MKQNFSHILTQMNIPLGKTSHKERKGYQALSGVFFIHLFWLA